MQTSSRCNQGRAACAQIRCCTNGRLCNGVPRLAGCRCGAQASHGGIACHLPHRKPMPVGPHILCEEATIQSAPSRCTSIGMLGTLWQQSSSTLAPTYHDGQLASWQHVTISDSIVSS